MLDRQFKVLCIFGLLNLLVAPSSAIYEKQIKTFLETWRHRMCHSLTKIGFPAIDPFVVGPVDYSLHDNYLYDLDVNIGKLNLTGISGFELKDLHVNGPLIKSNFNLSIPKLEFDINYGAFGSVGDLINLNCQDQKMKIILEGFNLQLSWRFALNIMFAIQNLEIDMLFSKLLVDFGDITKDEKINSFLNRAFNELGLGFLRDMWSSQKDYVENLIEKEINNSVNGLHFLHILKIIAYIKQNGLNIELFKDIEGNCYNNNNTTINSNKD